MGSMSIWHWLVVGAIALLLFGGKGKAPTAKKAAKKAGTTRKVAPKYRNPANAKETWSGRGKQPRWLAELVKKGKKPEDFLIRK